MHSFNHKRSVLQWTAMLLGLVLVSAAAAQVPQPRPLPQGAKTLLTADALTRFNVQSQMVDYGNTQVVDDATAPSGKIVRVTLEQTPPQWWHAQLQWPMGEVSKGQAILLRVLARSVSGMVESGEGLMELRAQKAVKPWTTLSGSYATTIQKQWRWFDLPVSVDTDDAAGPLNLVVNVGYFPQVIEFAAVEAFAFDPPITVKDLPEPLVTYDGREPDAAWRAEAAARIEKHRKGDLVVRVVDSAGRPVRGAAVKVDMTRHAFGFGTCVNENLEREGYDGDMYREKVRTLFNQAVFEGAMKWGPMVWNGGYKPGARMKTPEEQAAHLAKVDRQLQWLADQNIDVRGHNLVWPGWGTIWALLPPYLKPLVDAGDKDAVRREVDTHITKTASYFRGRVIEWDVTNETVTHHDLQDLLGREEMVRWYQLTQQADPTTKRYINDFCILSGGAVDLQRMDRFHDEVKFLLDHGAPIDGIGEQAHFGWKLVGIPRMLGLLDRFAGFGLPMKITEFDVAISDEQLQADYTRDFYTAAFSHPNIHAIVMWGFWEKSHWKPEAAMFHADWSPKPNAKVYEDLVFHQWWTNLAGQTDTTGHFRGRGFLGQYSITVTHNGVTTTTQCTLDHDGAAVTVREGRQ